MYSQYSGDTIAVSGLAAATWTKSSYCAGGSCMEIARLASGHVGVRDGKRGEQGEILIFAGEAWDAFLAGVRAGAFS